MSFNQFTNLDFASLRAQIKDYLRVNSEFADFEEEDLVEAEDMVITVTHRGYIKRVPLITYRAQKRAHSPYRAVCFLG